MDNFFGFLGAYYLIPSLIIGMIGFLLGWFLKPSKRSVGDLSVEGEGALRAEADSLRARVQDLETRLSDRETEVSQLKTQISATPPVGEAETVTAKTTENDDTYALEWQNRYLAARVKYLDSRLADAAADATPAKSVSPKKASAKKASPKKAPAKKTPAKKSAAKTAKSAASATPAKKGTTVKKVVTPKKPAAKTAKAKAAPAKTTKKKTAAKKAPAKSPAKKATDTKQAAKMNRYYENVKKYDSGASKTVVENIVKYCGVSLASRDSSLVACSDESELQTVAKGFVTKKLGQKDGQMELVKSVCEEMKGQRMKSRVTFYYLAARKVGKLDLFK